jgi:NAD(P)-dependent dehydrogenase (short-subunit alcohol dehydrogenase family)
MTSYIDEEIEGASRRFYPLGRLGVTDDIAPMITFLLSDRTSWVTGQAISISGGFGRS